MSSSVQPVPIEKWQEELDKATAVQHAMWRRVVVLTETDSTQDAARRMNAQTGEVIVAGRQTAGRGRLGRKWHEAGNDGVAVTFVVPAARPERLAIACAIDVADALMAAMKVTNGWKARKAQLGIKWPNDLIAQGRKVAGILIEQAGDRAYVGVGVNVRQESWPKDLHGRAISLRELGFDIDRLLVIDLLMQLMGHALRQDDSCLAARFAELDVLTGTTCGFRIGEREIRGKVLRVDPMNGLAVLTEGGVEEWLPAATTSVIKE